MILKAIILGIVQGFTEFLPISSSGHCALLEQYFGITEPVVLTTFLHFGTFLATLVYFLKPISRIANGLVHGDRASWAYALYIFIGTIPIVVFAVLFRTYIEAAFTKPLIIALFLGITGVVVLLTYTVRKGDNKVTFFSALIIGIGQMFATFPGISRSGMTISAGIFAKVKTDNAFTFSFLLSLPAVFGANLLELFSLPAIKDLGSIVIGVTCSFLCGLVALTILRKMIATRFHLFGIYCLVISVILLLVQ
jgi:undecaprenyl-diphosphatase